MAATPIADLRLDVRTYNTLARNGVDTVDDLMKHTEEEVMNFPNFGRTSMRNLRVSLIEAGLPPIPLVRPRVVQCPHCGGEVVL